MTDSDSDCEMVRVKSFEGHKFAPEEKVFSIKLKPILGKKRGYIYTLKKNQSLPYTPHLEDCENEITIGQDLKPTMSLEWERRLHKECWIFTEIGTDLNQNSSISPGKPLHSSSTLRSRGSRVDLEDGSLADESIDSSQAQVTPEDESKTEEEQIMTLFSINNDDSRLCQFSCKLCSYVTDWEDSCVRHMKKEHSGWKDELLGQQIESIPSSSQNSSQNPGLESSGQTPNSRPMWMDELRRDFQSIIVDKCSEQTRNAVANDEDIKDLRVRKLVRAEIMDSITDHIFTVYGGFGTPKLAVMREVSVLMGFRFPNMFQDKGSTGCVLGYGLGGKQGNKYLANHLLERFKALAAKAPAVNDEGNEEEAVEPEKKKVKKKEIYGRILL